MDALDPTMPLWEIALPAFTNDGQAIPEAHAAWQARALHIAGGYTRRPDGIGVWRDPADGKTCVDVMGSYRVACSAEAFGALLDEAFRIFPDQVGIYTARIGEATIVDRSAWNAMQAAACVPVVRL